MRYETVLTFRLAAFARRPFRRAGFTLVELVVAITAGAIISGIAGMLIWNATEVRTRVAARGEMIDMGSSAVEVMLRYMREIRQDENPGGPIALLRANAQISVADTATLQFDGFGFRQNGDLLEITTDGGTAWHPLASDVSALIFTYYDRNGVELASLPLSASDRQDVRRIQLRLDLARGPESAGIQTSIYLRNFMNEVDLAP